MSQCFSYSTTLHPVLFIDFCVSFRNYFGTWEEYSLPLIDTALGAGLLDFVDFHAYDTDATALVSITSTIMAEP